MALLSHTLTQKSTHYFVFCPQNTSKKESKKGTVSLGSKVDFVEEGSNEVMTYEIVGTTEADVEQGRISNESPIGNALLGRKANDVVNVLAPAGWITLIIKKVY